MKTIINTAGFCAIILLFFSWGCAVKQYSADGKLSFEENFNGSSLDTTRWSKIPRGQSDWNRHMSFADSCYEMKNGRLILRGFQNHNLQADTAPYVTGGVFTRGKVGFGFGRVEIRAKLNGAKGAWPAFWMLATKGVYPEGGEIDIMERLNHDSIAYQTVHSYYTITLNQKNNPKHHTTAAIRPGKFNTYAVEKYRDSLVFFVNGRRTFSYPRIKTDKPEQFPFDLYEHYLLLDMQLGGNWVGKVDPAQLPVEMQIDRVRFYQFPEKL